MPNARFSCCFAFLFLSGYILRDIPSAGDVISKIFDDPPSESPPAIAAAPRVAGGAGGGDSTGSPKSRGGGGEGSRGNSRSPTGASTAANAQADADVGDFIPTHVVYLHASLEHIVAQRGQHDGTRSEGTQKGGDAGGGAESDSRLREDIERYFSQEQEKGPSATTTADDGTSTPPGKQQPRRKSSKGSGDDKRRAATGEEPGTGERGGGKNSETPPKERWMPATARALQHRHGVEVEVIDAEGVEGGMAGVIAAVDKHVCGGRLPGFVWMLSDGDGGDGAAAAEGPAEEGEYSSPGAGNEDGKDEEERLLGGAFGGDGGEGAGEAGRWPRSKGMKRLEFIHRPRSHKRGPSLFTRREALPC